MKLVFSPRAGIKMYDFWGCTTERYAFARNKRQKERKSKTQARAHDICKNANSQLMFQTASCAAGWPCERIFNYSFGYTRQRRRLRFWFSGFFYSRKHTHHVENISVNSAHLFIANFLVTNVVPFCGAFYALPVIVVEDVGAAVHDVWLADHSFTFARLELIA